MKTEEEIRAALAQVREAKKQYTPKQSMYGYQLGAETFLLWVLDEETD